MSASGWREWLGPRLAVLFRLTLGAVFVAASLDKVLHPLAFAQSIANYRMVPLGLINLMAIALPMIELVSGVALLLGVGIRANLLLASGMLALFIVAIVLALVRGLDISCGCFTTDPSAHRMTRMTLIWDIIWLAMGVHALLYDRGLLSLEWLWRRRRARTRSA